MSLTYLIFALFLTLITLTHQQAISLNVEQNGIYQAYYRQLVKRENLNLIQQMNQDPAYTFSVSPNDFLYLRNDQFTSMYATSVKMSSNDNVTVDTNDQVKNTDETTPKNETNATQKNDSISVLLTPSKSISVNIDLTKFTSPVKDQGKCNSCYAHSAIATIESLLFQKFNQVYDLSQQQIVDCTKDWAPKQYDVYNNRGCVGGWGWISYEYFKSYGVTFENDYPYRSKRIGTEMVCRWNYITSKTFKVKDYKHYYDKKNPESQCSKLNDILLDGRTIATSIWVPKSPAFQFYGSATPGIDIWNLCGPYDDVNHELELVGSTDQYWKLKNSYGPTWGEKGFLYLDKSQGLNCLNICLDFAVSTGLTEDQSN